MPLTAGRSSKSGILLAMLQKFRFVVLVSLWKYVEFFKGDVEFAVQRINFSERDKRLFVHTNIIRRLMI
jgi:hypothetical protein